MVFNYSGYAAGWQCGCCFSLIKLVFLAILLQNKAIEVDIVIELLIWMNVFYHYQYVGPSLQITDDVLLTDRCVGLTLRNAKIRCGDEIWALSSVRLTGPRWLMILTLIVLWIELNTFRMLWFSTLGNFSICFHTVSRYRVS